jgi:hypothetical protein
MPRGIAPTTTLLINSVETPTVHLADESRVENVFVLVREVVISLEL